MSDKEAISQLFNILRKYNKAICSIIFYLLITTILTFLIPLLSKYIMDDGFIGGRIEVVILLALITLIIYSINSCLDIVKEKKRINISSQVHYSLSEQAFRHLLKLKINYFNNNNYAEILNNITQDISNMTLITDESFLFVITQTFSILGGVIGLFIIDYRMTILVLMFVPIKYFTMKYFARKKKLL
ncbi:MAG: ABC transporter transmembrane domain-containing protein [Lachnospiraceae bacterium]|nr:ABC transporter transmembrane domain-containing protein [Lachnospiraceae bacterium]